MPTTRKKAAHKKAQEDKNNVVIAGKKEAETGEKREDEQVTQGEEFVKDKPARKKMKTNEESKGKRPEREYKPKTGTIERGHIYFFYRPKVQLEEAASIEDVKHFHMLLVPRPPEFSTYIKKPSEGKVDKEENEDASMKVLSAGADAVPAPATHNASKKHYRLITVGKKHLPDPELGGKGQGRKQTFWADVTSIGDDLHSLEKGLGDKTYETKTRGKRHNDPARLVARGAYAFVNNQPHVPSQRKKDLGISNSSSFVVQVKNPLASPMNPQQAHTKGAEYPAWIMRDVFGKGGREGSKGREAYGLRFASCETPEMLDYVGTQLLLIAAREGAGGVETSLGEGRGKALEEAEKKESEKAVESIFQELGLDLENFPVEPLEGSWI